MLCALLLAFGVTRSLSAQTIDAELWGVDNTVVALARSGDTVYVGGAFGRVGPSTGGLVALPRRCDGGRRPFPRVTGYVRSIADDGQGGWFLSGDFTAVGGVPRYCLAHVMADGSVGPWDPNPNNVPYGAGGGLLVSGRAVFVSGGFATISGRPRQYIAALDAESGEALAWDAQSNGLVSALAVRGNVVYVGGLFTHIGGQPRNNLAALDIRTGRATAWNPDADGGVWSAAVRGKSVYVGGSFARIGGKDRSLLAELNAETGLATEWNPEMRGPGSPYPYLGSILVQGNRLLVGGSFSTVGGLPRRGLAEIDVRGGRPTDWDPQASATYGLPEISVMRAQGASLYVGGWFQSIGGKARNCVAELDARTGLASEWNPDPSSAVYAIGLEDDGVLIGGTFRSLAMVPRHNLAAFDLTTGRVTDWNPNPDGVIVYALAASGGRIYAGGHFGQIGGQPRSALAALDPVTGAATDWSPDPNETVRALLVDGNAVYVGGGFRTIGGQPRRFLAAVDASTGAALPWNPDPNDGAIALALHGDTLFAGGFFTMMGAQFRRSLAAVDASSGAVLPWRLDTDGVVEALTVAGNSVYAGGSFDIANGQPRTNLAAFDATTGALRPWAPNAEWPRQDYYTASVKALAARDSTIFVGGDFTRISGIARASLAAVHATTGAAFDWDPNPDQLVSAFDASGDRLIAGGYLQAAQRLPHLALIAVSYPGEDVTAPRFPGPPFARPRALLAPVMPNPVRAEATLRFSLAMAADVTLSLYDLQGRRVRRVLDHELRAAGDHVVRMETAGLRAGCYLSRLEAGADVSTQKLVVIQ